MAGGVENSALLLLLTMKFTVWLDSFDGPALMAVAQLATVCAPAFRATDWSAPLVKLGVSLTAVTVTDTVALPDSAPAASFMT